MSEKIAIVCPQCGHTWEESLQELEKIEKGYRAVCPVDGAHIILEVPAPGNLPAQEESGKENEFNTEIEEANSLSILADMYMAASDFDKTEESLKKSLALRQKVGLVDGIAFSMVKLAQVAQARGDKEAALLHYREGLALFEELEAQPLIAQVKQLIDNLENGAMINDTPLTQAIRQARDAAQHGDVQSAIQHQEQAVSLARGAGEGRNDLIRLSVTLYNLAGYYTGAERFEDAVKALEEVVALDEQTENPDLESDRQTLEAARRNTALTAEEREQIRQRLLEGQGSSSEDESFESQLQAQLAQIPLEQRAEVEANYRKGYAEFQRLSPEEKAERIRAQQAAEEANMRKRVDQAAEQTRDMGLAYVRGQVDKQEVVQSLEEAAAQINANEKPGSPWLDVARLCQALAALIKGESIPPVPAAYDVYFSAVISEMK